VRLIELTVAVIGLVGCVSLDGYNDDDQESPLRQPCNIVLYEASDGESGGDCNLLGS
jgi:hypothetical protein